MSNMRRRVSEALYDEQLLELLAGIEHERWSHWQRYLHSKCVRGDDGSLTIPPELVTRWSKQMHTAYPDLSDDEKKSDRDQVRRYLPAIAAVLDDGEQ